MKILFALYVITVAALIALVTTAIAEAGHHPTSSSYEKTVNTTMNMQILVMAEWRETHKKFTWQELHREVCQRLKVRRVEIWAQ